MEKMPYPILAFFSYDHLPMHLQAVSKPFWALAWQMVEGHSFENRTTDAETAAGLRKLLEAKDCAVRAALGREQV